MCLKMVGGECIFAGKVWAIFELPMEYPSKGDGDLWGDVGWGVGEGVRARGERGILPADFLLPDLYLGPPSFGPNPCRVLGLTCPEPAGEFGALELGELLCEEFVPD